MLRRGPISEPLRRAPFVVAFFTRALITTVLILVAYGIGDWLCFPIALRGESPFLDLARDTGYALLVAVVSQFGADDPENCW